MAIMALEDLYVCLRTVEPSGGGVGGVARGEGGVRGGAVIECSIAKMMTVERDWETKAFVMILQGMWFTMSVPLGIYRLSCCSSATTAPLPFAVATCASDVTT